MKREAQKQWVQAEKEKSDTSVWNFRHTGEAPWRFQKEWKVYMEPGDPTCWDGAVGLDWNQCCHPQYGPQGNGAGGCWHTRHDYDLEQCCYVEEKF